MQAVGDGRLTRLQAVMVGYLVLSGDRRTSTDEEADDPENRHPPREESRGLAHPAFQFDCSFDPGQNGSMDDAHGRRNLPSRWSGVEETLPASLSHLAGPPGGVVELPHDLAWSGRRSFDLANPVQRYIYHMTVLTAGVTREHYTNWLNVDLLRSEWTSLGLPRPLRRVWEDHFPELASVRAKGD